MDFMATIMEVLDLERPADQKDWAFDGVSVLPILKGESVAERGIGWMYSKPVASPKNGYAFRYGNWKLAVGGVSCSAEHASFDCSQPQLYDMSVDKEENFDLSKKEPVVFAAIQRNFTIWFNSVHNSISNESKCDGGSGPPAGKFPANPPVRERSLCRHLGVPRPIRTACARSARTLPLLVLYPTILCIVPNHNVSRPRPAVAWWPARR